MELNVATTAAMKDIPRSADILYEDHASEMNVVFTFTIIKKDYNVDKKQTILMKIIWRLRARMKWK